MTALDSCADEKNGRRDFEKILASDYTAEIEFSVDFMGNPLAGEAVVTRSDTVRIDILSPDPYSGISVESDADDKASVISISYAGVKAEIPKQSLEKIEFVIGMFSDSASNAVAKAKKEAFAPCSENYISDTLSETVPYECVFSVGENSYSYIYDSRSGMPLELFGANDGCKAEIKINKLKIAE